MRLSVVTLILLGTWTWAEVASADEKQVCTDAYVAAQSLRGEHRLVAARDQLRTCARQECASMMRGQMVTDCAGWLTQVESALPSVAFQVTDANGDDATGVTIRIDGQRLAGAGTAIDLDPGEHTFVFEVAGVAKTVKKLVVVEGVKHRREVIVLGAAAPTTSPPPTLGVVPATSPHPELRAPAQSSGPPTLAFAALGVGGAGLVLGVVSGLVANGQHSTLQGVCDNTARTCAPQYSGDLDSFHTWRTASTIGYVVGALGIAGGGVLWLTAPKASSTTAQVWIGPASAGVAGRF